MGNRMYRLQG